MRHLHRIGVQRRQRRAVRPSRLSIGIALASSTCAASPIPAMSWSMPAKITAVSDSEGSQHPKIMLAVEPAYCIMFVIAIESAHCGSKLTYPLCSAGEGDEGTVAQGAKISKRNQKKSEPEPEPKPKKLKEQKAAKEQKEPIKMQGGGETLMTAKARKCQAASNPQGHEDAEDDNTDDKSPNTQKNTEEAANANNDKEEDTDMGATEGATKSKKRRQEKDDNKDGMEGGAPSGTIAKSVAEGMRGGSEHLGGKKRHYPETMRPYIDIKYVYHLQFIAFRRNLS